MIREVKHLAGQLRLRLCEDAEDPMKLLRETLPAIIVPSYKGVVLTVDIVEALKIRHREHGVVMPAQNAVWQEVKRYMTKDLKLRMSHEFRRGEGYRRGYRGAKLQSYSPIQDAPDREDTKKLNHGDQP